MSLHGGYARKGHLYATREDWARAQPFSKTNDRGGKCLDCGQYVEPHHGVVVRRNSNGRKTWHVGHAPVVGECPAHTQVSS